MRLGAFVIALIAAVVLLVVRPGSDQASSAGGGHAAGQLLLLYNSHGSVPALNASARRFKYVVLQPWDVAGLRAVKRKNPHAIVLAYQEASAMAHAPAVTGITASGVGYAQANSHERWFLHNRSGGRITEAGYSYLYMANIGSRSYQRAWAANVSRLLRRGPWDGVLMDDVNTTAGFHTNAAQVAEYAGDAAYSRATTRFLNYVRPRLRGSGKLELANIGGWIDHPQLVRDWLHKLDGAMDEAFVKFSPTPGQDYRNRFQWNVQLGEVRTTEAMGKHFLAVTRAFPSDGQAELYGWGSLLLASRGHAGYLPATGFGYDAVPAPLPGSVRSVGVPRGGTHSAGRLVFRRFSRALVVVNPDSVPHTAHFAVQMKGPDLGSGSVATMPAHSALILHRANRPRRAPPQHAVSSP